MQKFIFIIFLINALFSGELYSNDNQGIKEYLEINKNATNIYNSMANQYKIKKSYEPFLQRGKFEYKIEKNAIIKNVAGGGGKDSYKRYSLDLGTHARFGFFSVCLNHNFIAYTIDPDGAEKYKLYLYDMDNEAYKKIFSNIQKVVYCYENEIYFQQEDKISSINFKTLEKENIFQSNDPNLVLSFYPSADNEHLIILQNDTNTSLSSILNLKTKIKKLVQPKQEGLEYYIDIIDKEIFKFTQNNASSVQTLEKANINDFDFKTIFKFKNQVQKWHLFENFLAFQTQNSYKTNLLVLDHQGHQIYNKQLNNDTSSAWLSKNDYAFTDVIKAKVQSLTKPPKWIFINPIKKHIEEKEAKIFDNYNYSNYHSELVFVGDLPVSIAFNKKKIKPNSPVYLISYGAYFENIKRYFMPEIISLLDLGFIYAIAHIRGGNFLGENWALAGMGRNRQNSIDDLLKVASFLKSYNNGNHKVLSHGQSAGATILAAAINQNPKAFDAAILQVPFLGVLNSLKNMKFFQSIEFAQWGNPNSESKAIQKYDPIQNIKKQKYPNLLVMASANDIRVGYKDAIKYTQLIRKNSKDSLTLFYLNRHGGHQSSYESGIKENIIKHTFLINEGLK